MDSKLPSDVVHDRTLEAVQVILRLGIEPELLYV